ncbi:MAG TPA: ABC transporter permease subunit [Candidatus Eisenbacteria bacterium]|nr:ABC transporter permease subunit [Candidatus Eisenbacteria bacterium]
MTAELGRPAAAAPTSSIRVMARIYGFGSIFGKTLRDSRRALLLVVAFLTFFVLVGAAAIASAFGTPETRQEMVALATTLPSVFQGLLGRPVGLETLGGLIEWRYYSVIFLLFPIWSILALSGTLAGEADRGSLDLLLTSPFSRRRVALEKLTAHLVALAIAMVVLALILWACGLAFAPLPGDEIPLGAAAAYALFSGLLILVPGSIAFAAAPFLGRGAAAGLAAVAMVVAYFVNGFRSSIPAFESLTPLSWYAWTAEHIPLAGQYDWPSLVPVALLIAALLTLGLVAFERRDVGITVHVPAPHLPGLLVGLRGPMGRSFGERFPAAVAWGLGIGLYVLIIASSSSQLADMIRNTPTLETIMGFLYPDIDYGSVGGVLQLVFLDFGLIVFGLAAATLVGGWASDEASGRLDVLLSAPLSRASWLVRSGLGVFAAIVLASAIVALGTAVGAAAQGSDVVTPTLGAFVLALYGLAWAGVGIAVGGLVRPSLAAPTVAVLTVGTFLITLFATALKLPDWVAELALSSHYGKPFTGDWDPVGIGVSLALAFGGLAVGAWGLSRRDLRG